MKAKLIVNDGERGLWHGKLVVAQNVVRLCIIDTEPNHINLDEPRARRAYIDFWHRVVGANHRIPDSVEPYNQRLPVIKHDRTVSQY